jgi:hypothetical protein
VQRVLGSAGCFEESPSTGNLSVLFAPLARSHRTTWQESLSCCESAALPVLLTKCGVCGAGFILGSANRLSCFGARDKGTCSNRLTIRREEVEARVLQAAEAIRGLIDTIVLTPAADALEAHVVRRGRRARGPAEAGHYERAADSGLHGLRGNLAAMLSAAQDATRPPETGDCANAAS